MTELSLSEKRRIAGRKGARSRWQGEQTPDRLNVARSINGRTDGYVIKNRTQENTDILLYEDIGPWGVTALEFVSDLMDIQSAQITLSINSPGGDVFDGFAMYNALLKHPANIIVEIDGLAASAASYVAMAADEIRIARNAQMMIHPPSGMVIGGSDDMRQLADELDKIGGTIADTYAQRAGGDVAEWSAAMDAETWYTGAEAVAAGLADSVMERAGTVDNRWDTAVFKYRSRNEAPAPYIPDTTTGDPDPVTTVPEPDTKTAQASAEAEPPETQWRTNLAEAFARIGGNA